MKKARGKTAAAATAPIVGAQEFLRFVYEIEPEWSVWAVEAPIDAVAPALVELTGGEVWSKDILDKPRAANGADVGKMIPMISVKGGSWVVGYRTVGFYMSKEGDLADEQAARLSRKLKTRALAYHREDKSGWTDYELFESGKSAGKIGGDDVPEDFPDQGFQELGLVVPACVWAEHNGKIELSVSALSKKIIDRVYMIYEGDPGRRKRAGRKGGGGAGPGGEAD
jgi:hypothetical protein